VSKLVNCTIEYSGGDNFGNVFIENALPTVSGRRRAYAGPGRRAPP
jgi:hypothetical protein